MDETTLSELRKARDLLRAEKPEEARPILVGLLKQDPNNEHAWYLLGFALSDPERRRYAFQQALRINPGHEKARKQLGILSETAEEPVSEPTEVPTAPEDYGEGEAPTPVAIPVEVEPSEEPEKQDRPKRRRSPVGTVLLLSALCLLLIIVGVGAVYYLTGGTFAEGLLPVGLLAPTQPPTAPPVAQPSEPPTITPIPPTSTSTLTPTITPSATEWVHEPTFVPVTCNFAVPKSATVECGYVSVPEIRGVGPPRTIRLSVAVYRSTSDTPAAEPVIFLSGGPGSGALETVALLYDGFVDPILKERDFIAFDQRGTGSSEPSLDCPEIYSIYMRDLRQTLTDSERATLYTNAVQACRDRLTLTGVNLDAYTSAASAADVKDITSALGYERVNLYGVSYGTRLALTVMRDYTGIVRSAVLDSALPLEARLYNELTARTDHALDVLFAGCAADSQCKAAYPNLETVFYELVDQLDAKPIDVLVPNPLGGQPTTVKVDGAGFISTIRWGLYYTDLIPTLPKAIYDVQEGDYSYLSVVLLLMTTAYDSTSIGMHLSVNCHEQVFATTERELNTDLAEYPELEDFGRSAIYGGAEVLFSICETWGAASFNPEESKPLVSDIPTLILGGQYDPATPPTYSKPLTENLNQSDFIEFPGEGHSLSAGLVENCPLKIALAFLSDPNADPENACLAEMSGPEFVVP